VSDWAELALDRTEWRGLLLLLVHRPLEI
jgi:hypothetical protein